MASKSEVGYAKTLAAFQNIVVHCQGLGAPYNPANTAIGLPGLQTAFAQARQSQDDVNDAKNNLNNATNARKVAFLGLGKFGTRMVNALDASGATPETVANAHTILRKLRGGGRRKPKTTEPAEALPAEGQTPLAEPGMAPATSRTISVSHHSLDNQAEYFARLLVLLSAETLYAPNEAELGLAALQTKQEGLNLANLTVQQNTVAHENAIIQRNAVLYGPDTGLAALAGDVKKYVLSVYGSTSPQYKAIAAIYVGR